MGVGIVWGMSASVLAACAGMLIGHGIGATLERKRRHTSVVYADVKQRISATLKKGIPLFMPVARFVLRSKRVERSIGKAVFLLQGFGSQCTDASFLSVLMAFVTLIGLLLWIVSHSAVYGAAVAAIAVIAVFGAIKAKSDKQSLAMREAIPEALRCMSACFRSGQSLVQTLKHTEKEIGGPLGRVFKVAADRLDMGETTQRALDIMRSDQSVPELSFVAVALDVQHQCGGSIAPVLESARESVESELELMRSLRVQTAQAKLSASIVTVMPFILIALFSLMSPDFLSPFFSSFLGMFLLGAALSMQLAGVLLVRRMLKIDAE